VVGRSYCLNLPVEALISNICGDSSRGKSVSTLMPLFVCGINSFYDLVSSLFMTLGFDLL